jgi:hypothetical protein
MPSRLPAFLVFVLLSLVTSSSNGFLVSVADDQEIEIVANPHSEDNVCSGSALLDRLLEPYQLIIKPVMTQADTFQELSYAKVLTVPVPVYTMKQPERLSVRQLEFQLVLVKGLAAGTANLLQEVPVPMEQAVDSWFPGYYWTPIIMACGGNDNNFQHVGWKFTVIDKEDTTTSNSNNNNNNNTLLPHFYALMVQMNRKEKTQGLRIGGFRAPGWMVETVYL